MSSNPAPPLPAAAPSPALQAGSGLGWGAVVALKRSTVAKSRLGRLPVPIRRRLAEAMAWDTLTALCQVIDRVIVVSDDPELPGKLQRLGIPAAVLAEPEPAGMNAALRAGDQRLRDQGCTRVLACVGDLPGLTARALRVLQEVVHQQRDPGQLFVADHTGTGTTMLIADRVPLDPHFQGESAAAHRAAGAVAISEPDHPGLRNDVDSLEDLARVVGLGVGPYTAALVDPDTGRPATYVAITVAGSAATGDELSVITDDGVRLQLPEDAREPRLRLLRPGQRLHAARVGDRIVSAWL